MQMRLDRSRSQRCAVCWPISCEEPKCREHSTSSGQMSWMDRGINEHDANPTETGTAAAVRPTLRRRLATSQTRMARMARWIYWTVNGLSVPAPKVVVMPFLWLFLSVRSACCFVCASLFANRSSSLIARNMGATCILIVIFTRLRERRYHYWR